MQLSDAAEIIELFGVKEVNAALQAGWRLLAATSVHKTASETDVCYTLGKPNGLGIGSPGAGPDRARG